jgi:hypothetical protein
MSTSPIRLGARKLPAKRSARGATKATARGHVPMGGVPHAEDSLRTHPQVAAKPLGDLGRDRAALQAHVEQALAGFFGPRLVLAPRFQDIVSQTVEALLAEPALEDCVQVACRVLRGDVRKD